MIKLNNGDSNMQNEISKDIDKLILKYGVVAVKNVLNVDTHKHQVTYLNGDLIAPSPIVGDRLVANSEVKAPKVKYHPLPTYIGEQPINNVSSFLDDVKCGHFIGSDVTVELDDGQEITIAYKEQYNENSTFKEYIERSIRHACRVLKNNNYGEYISPHKKATKVFDDLIKRYGFVVMSDVAKSKI